MGQIPPSCGPSSPTGERRVALAPPGLACPARARVIERSGDRVFLQIQRGAESAAVA